MPLLIALCFTLAAAAGAEIRDVLKAAEIDAQLAAAGAFRAIHEAPGYAIGVAAHTSPSAGAPHPDFDEIAFVRRGSGSATLAGKRYTLGPGDLVSIPRNTTHPIDPGSGRLELLVVKIFPTGERLPARTGFLAPRVMPAVTKKADIDATISADSGGCRSPFRTDVDHDSEVMPISVPN